MPNAPPISAEVTIASFCPSLTNSSELSALLALPVSAARMKIPARTPSTTGHAIELEQSGYTGVGASTLLGPLVNANEQPVNETAAVRAMRRRMYPPEQILAIERP